MLMTSLCDPRALLRMRLCHVYVDVLMYCGRVCGAHNLPWVHFMRIPCKERGSGISLLITVVGIRFLLLLCF